MILNDLLFFFFGKTTDQPHISFRLGAGERPNLPAFLSLKTGAIGERLARFLG